MSNTDTSPATFGDLGLSTPILNALTEVGYETPSPIQARSIPPLLEGRDLLGMAQTGTGKTAAFALPLLQRIDTAATHPQLLILAPTRELALQVATACEKYSKHLPGLRTLSIYGGQGYDSQIRGLRRGAQVIIGTPGRVMDHIRRGTLQLDRLQALVLDEADEMLRMGFIDDVEWILQHTPSQRQIALFSATMPQAIRHIAENYLQDPAVIKIQAQTATASTIRQRAWVVRGMSKTQALTRILEQHEHEAALVFVRTKTATETLAEELNQAGFPAAALHGDIAQVQRERIVSKLKKGELDVVIATDVVARGLDVERISHVVNYDIPYDTESYIHRIGRTGRAGRQGDAILFVAPREQRLLKQIERATRQPLETLKLPTAKEINALRAERLQAQILAAAEKAKLDDYMPLISKLQENSELSAEQLIAATIALMHSDKPLWMDENEPDPNSRPAPRERQERGERGERGERPRRNQRNEPVAVGMERYWIGVGHLHGVKPGNIVGAIANEAGIESRLIGRINIADDFSCVDLPAGLEPNQLQTLKRARVCGQRLDIRPWQENGGAPRRPRSKAPVRRQPRD
ncbi:DEAD/DEAH box helicase [Marinobacterium sediminicola]|uniref:ATP-dependent RNA helicase DeaD n=1 Tax=Marinobacterium sediminicola TaxID=518898 RepID=A0ABY1RWF4_9GAMM|nr:DEAD/DEAH box helicase [Marinobacterium sediminicola]ULG70340.1 DEAD/DEAH box helicase [Marinobacterium sediminicola]SMR69691.1 ATP-dependent RNA helicase DeaD [Marinobacterium sediminicola]